MNRISLDKKETLFNDTDAVTHVYLIKSGVLKLVKNNFDGSQRIAEILSKDDYIGAVLAFKDAKIYGSTAIAVRDSLLIKMTIEEFNTYLDERDNRKHFIEKVCDKTIYFKKMALDTYTVEEKIISGLEVLFKDFGEVINNKKVITLPINKSDFSLLIGARRETITRKLREMDEEGLITIDGKRITIN